VIFAVIGPPEFDVSMFNDKAAPLTADC